MTRTEVVVAGLTPAGLVVAVDLARRDIVVRVVRTGLEPAGEVTLAPRTQEVLDDLGVRQLLLPHADLPAKPKRQKRWDGQPFKDSITVPTQTLTSTLRGKLAEYDTEAESRDSDAATYVVEAHSGARQGLGEDTFKHDNRFLVDHADHNLAIQDAYNLGWKLAAAVYGAEPELLDTYGIERAAARSQRDAHNAHYRDSRMSQELGGRRLRIHAGDRVPDLRLWSPEYGDIRLFDLLKGPRWTVLGIGSVTAESAIAVRQRFGDSLRVEVVGGGVGRNLVPGVTLQDRHGDALRLLTKNAGMLLAIRPDGHLGLRSNPDPEIVGAYLEGTLGIWDEAAL